MNIPVLIAFATDLRVGLSSCFLTSYENVGINQSLCIHLDLTCSGEANVEASHFLTSSGTASFLSLDKSSSASDLNI